MKKKKDSLPNTNWIMAIVFFVVATLLMMFEIKMWSLYAFAAIFWINYQFDKTNWLILDIARTFVDGMKSPEEREGGE